METISHNKQKGHNETGTSIEGRGLEEAFPHKALLARPCQRPQPPRCIFMYVYSHSHTHLIPMFTYGTGTGTNTRKEEPKFEATAELVAGYLAKMKY